MLQVTGVVRARGKQGGYCWGTETARDSDGSRCCLHDALAHTKIAKTSLHANPPV
jgi:hypothetical protein